MQKLTYRQPDLITVDEAETAFASNEPLAICRALSDLAFNHRDWRYVQDKCLEMAKHPDAGIRQAAATCLAHVARIHQQLEMGKVRPVINELLKDPEKYVRGCAEDALEDMQIFMRIDLRDE